MSEDRDIRKEVTSNWLNALDHLVSIEKVKSYRRFAEILGIDHQRINSYKGFINQGKRPSYVNTDYVVLINEKFHVSFLYLLKGEGEILESSSPPGVSNSIDNPALLKRTLDIEDKIEILNKRVQILERTIQDF